MGDRCTFEKGVPAVEASLQMSDEPFFATSKVTKEAEIPQEGFSLIFRRVKLLPDSNISIWLIFCLHADGYQHKGDGQ